MLHASGEKCKSVFFPIFYFIHLVTSDDLETPGLPWYPLEHSDHAFKSLIWSF